MPTSRKVQRCLPGSKMNGSKQKNNGTRQLNDHSTASFFRVHSTMSPTSVLQSQSYIKLNTLKMTKLSKGTSSTNSHTKAMKSISCRRKKKRCFLQTHHKLTQHLTAKHFWHEPKHFLALWMFKQSLLPSIIKKFFLSSNAQQKSVYIAYL